MKYHETVFDTEANCILHFKELIANKQNISACFIYHDKHGGEKESRCPIFEGIKQGYLEAIKICVPYPLGPNKIYNKTTLLIEAIKYEKLNIVKYLISCGVNVCQEDSRKTSPLSVAVEKGRLDIIKMLLKHGSKLSLQTAFIDAIRAQNQSIVKCFIENGVLVNFQYKVAGVDTPLREAIDTGNPDIVEILIQSGADPKLPGLYDELPLLNSIQRNPKIAKILLENGAEFNESDSSGKIPLIEAIITQDFELAKCMVKKGADVNKCDSSGKVPLIEAILTEDFELIKSMIENGAEVNKCDYRGKVPLIQAILTQNFELVKCMVEKGADVNVTTNKQQCGLSVAAKLLHLPIFEFLIESEAKLELAKDTLEEVAQMNDNFRAYFERISKGIKKSSTLSGSDHEEEST